jgi:hypothetical protein
MLDNHAEKKKPAGGNDEQQCLKNPVRPHIMQEKEPGPAKSLTDEPEVPEDEVIGLPEEWIVGMDSPRETPVEKPADPPMVPRPKILSAVKGAMKDAHLPKPDFPKPVRRPQILPDPVFPEPSVQTDTPNPALPVIVAEPPVTPHVLPASEEIPPFCKNCGKRVPPVANFCPACGTPLGSLHQVQNRPVERKTTTFEPGVSRKKGTKRK